MLIKFLSVVLKEWKNSFLYFSDFAPSQKVGTWTKILDYSILMQKDRITWN